MSTAVMHAHEECAICLTGLVESTKPAQHRVSLKPCRHIFHKGCMDAWLRQSLTCPCCRAPLGDGRWTAHCTRAVVPGKFKPRSKISSKMARKAILAHRQAQQEGALDTLTIKCTHAGIVLRNLARDSDSRVIRYRDLAMLSIIGNVGLSIVFRDTLTGVLQMHYFECYTSEQQLAVHQEYIRGIKTFPVAHDQRKRP
eukprot:m.3399 g.3399  ORF g.3399 m.3399 type:complete len:198 (+) comp5246_c0_seq1:24-617(+)